jgi:molybdopterin-containing oxidoreductase family membrane subunit
MATQVERAPLPYGIGRFGTRWLMAAAILAAVVGVGAYAYSRQVTEGEVVTGLRDVGTGGGAPWGLYIAFELWAVGAGFGAMMLVAAIALSRSEVLKPLTRILLALAMIVLFLGGWSVIADVGQPLRAIVNIIRYARPMSPFFGTFTIGLVTAFAVTLVYLYLDSRRDAAALAKTGSRWGGLLRLIAAGYRDSAAEQARHRQASRALAVVLLVVGIAAASTSGFVFGVQLGRPGWFSSLQAPGFVILAALTGTGFVVIIAAAVRVALNERERLSDRLFTWLGNLMLVFAAAYVYFMLVELITSSYSEHHHEVALNRALLKGQYAWLFWTTWGLFLVSVAALAWQAVVRRRAIPVIVAAGLLVNLAALGKRYLLVVPPLTSSSQLPYGVQGTYTPSWIEYAVVAGLIALGAALFLLFCKIFPILEPRPK